MIGAATATQTLCFSMTDDQYTKLITAYASNYHWKPALGNPVPYARSIMIKQFQREVNRYDLITYRINLTGGVYS
jgi:hypothetical protein